jgi:TP901 family phage tail tape measure protein
MAKKILKSDISEEDVFKGIRDSAQNTLKTIKNLDKELREIANTLKNDIKGAKFANSADINKFTKAVNQANKAKKDAIKIDQQAEKANKQLVKSEAELQRIKREKLKTEREEIRTAQARAKAKEQERKANEKNARTVENERNAYKKLVVETRNLKNESKRLAARLLEMEKAGQKNTRSYRELRREYKQVTRQAQEGDKALKGIDKTVGDNFRNVGNYVGAVNKLKGALAGLGVAFGAFQAIRSSAKIVAQFDQAQADLQAISGKTADQLADLTAQAKELGATTQFSATQITEMQIELAKLGFTNEQIADSTGAVANFAAATGAEIPRAAALAGSAMRGFNLEASEMDRVVSTLAVATTKTALDFSKLETGLSTVAPVAASFGFSIEDTTALLGQLANAGFDASSAATATRNILLNLADANGSLAKELGRPIESADDLAAGLQELQARGIDLGEALELTDKRSVAAFQTFLKGSDSLVELRDSITDANDELEAMAEKRLDTISGQFTLLESAWEGFILSLNEGTGIGETVKNLIGFIAENLNTILGVLGQVIKLWAIYRVVTSKAAKSLAAFSGALFKSIKGLKLQDLSLKNISKSAKGAAKGAKLFGGALKSIGFAIAIDLAIKFANAMYELATGIDEVRRAEELRRMATDAAKKATEADLEKSTAEIEKQIEKEEQLARRRIANGENAVDVNEELLEKKKKLFDDEKDRIEGLKLAEQKRWAELRNSKDELEKLTKVIQDNGAKSRKGLAATTELSKKYKDLGVTIVKSANAEKAFTSTLKNVDPVIAAQKAKVDTYNTALEDLEKVESELGTQIIENNAERKTGTRVVEGQTKTTKKLNTELKTEIDLVTELNELYERQADVQKTLKELDLTQQITELNEQIAEATLTQRANIEQDGFYDISQIKELANERKDLEIQLIETRRDAEIEANDKAFKNRFDALKRSLKDELTEQKKANEESGRSNADIAAANAKLDADFKKKSDEIDKLEKEEFKTLQEEKIAIKEDANNEILGIEKDTADEINGIDEELTNDMLARNEKLLKDDEAKAKAELEAQKKRAQEQREVIRALTDYAIEQSNKRIEAIDKEIEAAEKQSDHLKDLAAQGNIEASESIAEQQRIIAEANRAREKELQRQQRIKLASTIYDTYQSKIEAGSAQPLAETIRDTTLLQAFINSLPAFEDGTEDTGTNGKGVDGKGGFHAILHPKERVMTKGQNEMIGDLSNVELAKLAQEYNAGQMIHKDGAKQIGGAWESVAIVKKLNDLQKAIENKPETNIELERIIDGTMKITRQTKHGNNVIYNRYKVRK